MEKLAEIQKACEGMSCHSLLEYLIKDRFPGKIVLSASLRARSVVVQQIVADIDPATPVICCHAGKLYPESEEYRQFLCDRFGFTDIRSPEPHEVGVQPHDHDHIEWMKASYEDGSGYTQEALHLNKSLENAECWISGVYHFSQDITERSRVEQEGRLLRINPILDWDQKTVRHFMDIHDLPYHKMAKTDQLNVDDKRHGDDVTIPTMAF